MQQPDARASPAIDRPGVAWRHVDYSTVRILGITNLGR